jgi:peptidoglycan/xylan/chitin deacetylase (PgdA/CDA1 family)
MVVKIRKKFCLTFDIEEFDIAKGITEEEMYKISLEGTKNILKILKEENVRATFFITSNFAKKYPELVRDISKEHEIASHGEMHKHDYQKLQEHLAYDFIKKSKETLEKITKKEVQGFRSPRMGRVNPMILKKLGINYDASSQPAPIPGRMKDFFNPRKITVEDGIKIVPSSVTPIIKIPLMWYGFRNLGRAYAKTCTRLAAINNNYVSTYFHPWEFVDITKYNVSEGIKRNTGEKMGNILKNYIRWCKNRYDFITIAELIRK